MVTLKITILIECWHLRMPNEFEKNLCILPINPSQPFLIDCTSKVKSDRKINAVSTLIIHPFDVLKYWKKLHVFDGRNDSKSGLENILNISAGMNNLKNTFFLSARSRRSERTYKRLLILPFVEFVGFLLTIWPEIWTGQDLPSFAELLISSGFCWHFKGIPGFLATVQNMWFFTTFCNDRNV